MEGADTPVEQSKRGFIFCERKNLHFSRRFKTTASAPPHLLVFVGPHRVCRHCKVNRCTTEGVSTKNHGDPMATQALEDPFFGGEYFEAYEHLEEPKMVILEE